MEAPSEKYETIEDARAISRIFTLALDQRVQVMVWTPNQGSIFKTVLESMENKNRSVVVRVPPSIRISDFEGHLRKSNDRVAYINLYVPNLGVYSCRSTLLGVEPLLGGNPEMGFRFLIPARLIRYLQRGRPRYSIPGGYAITGFFEIETHDVDQVQQPGEPQGPNPKTGSRRLKPINGTVLDVAGGGISMAVPTEVAQAISVNSFLRNLQFAIRGRRVFATAKVTSINSVYYQKTDCRRLGIAFQNISKEDEAFLEAYVAEHMLQYAGWGL